MSVMRELDVVVRKCRCRCTCIICGPDGGHCGRNWLECFVTDNPMCFAGNTGNDSSKLLAAQGP